MPRVTFVKKARKPIPAHGIKAGDSYYWWKNRAKGARSGVKRISKTRPKPSQLTMSSYYSTVYAIQESCEAAADGVKTVDDLEGLAADIEQLASEVRDAGVECQSKLDNMPEGLQQGDSGQMLTSRVQACDSVADELEQAAGEIRDLAEGDKEEGFDLGEEAQSVIANLSFDWDG